MHTVELWGLVDLGKAWQHLKLSDDVDHRAQRMEASGRCGYSGVAAKLAQT